MQLEHWISHAASRVPGKIAIRCRDESLSYAQFERLISRLAWLLNHRYGITAGDRVAHLALNSPMFLALVFACARTGAILVPLNYRLARPELRYHLDDSGPKLLFIETSLVAGFVGKRGVPASCRLVSIDGPDEAHGCDDLLAQLSGDEFEQAPQVPSDPTAALLIVYTSGTTGKPKGVVLDQKAIRWNALNSQHMHKLTAEDHVLTVLPFFHVGGINIQTLPVLHCGGTVTLLPTFDPEEVLATITNDRPTLTVLVPTQMQAIAALQDWDTADLSSLRAVTTGSTIVDAGLLERWEKHDIRTLQIYGCTESCPIAIHQSIGVAGSPLGSVGKVAQYCEVRIVDEDDALMPRMSRGEVQLRGPAIMRGYWNQPEKSAAALKDGWLRTGDIGYRDEDGNYFIVDRIKNMIISGGENIFPAEIEKILAMHTEISEASVIGIPDDRWGEVVATAIVPHTGSELDDAAVLEYLGRHLGRYKLPRRIVFCTELPRNAMGKVDTGVLRSQIISPG